MKIIEHPRQPYGRQQWLYEKHWRCWNCKALISITPGDVERGVVTYHEQDPYDQRGNDYATCACPCCGENLHGITPGGGERRR